jgi:hypothetical protein
LAVAQCSMSLLKLLAFNVGPWECLLAAVVSPCGISSQSTLMAFSPGLVTVQRVVSLGCNKLCFFRCIITSTGSSNVYHWLSQECCWLFSRWCIWDCISSLLLCL